MVLKSIEATIGTDGRIELSEPVDLAHPCRAIVTILDEPDVAETSLLSEGALARDWNRPEEDEAWSSLQQAQ